MANPILFPGGLGSGQVTTVLGGVVNRFTGSTILTAAFTNGLWLSEIPEEYTLPFIALFHDGETCEWNSEAEVDEVTQCHFEIYQVGAEATEALVLKVKNRFDWPPGGYDLKVTGASTTRADRLNYTLSATDRRNESAQVVHQAILPYEFEIHRLPRFDTA